MPLVLRLFVAGDGPNSREAVANLNAIRKRCLRPEDHRLEIIDVLEDPLRALEDGVFVTPTLLALNSPVISIVGTLADQEKVIRALGLMERRDTGGASES